VNSDYKKSSILLHLPDKQEIVSLLLEHGGLLMMKDTTQQNWQHRLSPTKSIMKQEINLTFRTIGETL
jgi:alkylated DNA repair dioxygenase AlkB